MKILIKKSLDDHGEWTDVYECDLCNFRSMDKVFMQIHERKCYHEEEARTGNL